MIHLYKQKGKKMKRTIFLSLSAVLLAGCSISEPSVTPQARVTHTTASPISKEKRFHTTIMQIAQSTQNNPNYHKMGLKSDMEKKWFKDLMYRLWDREITRKQFIEEGVKHYPSHRYEFTYIANAFQNY